MNQTHPSTTTGLHTKHCKASTSSTPVLSPSECKELLSQIDPAWMLSDSSNQITRTFKFNDYYQTIAFVNVIAWIANQQDHHPELNVSYNRCRIVYSTHAIGGLSENDFICAAKIDALHDGII